MRQRLLPGLIRAAVYNQDRGSQSVSLFEVGRVYFKGKDDGPDHLPPERRLPTREQLRVGGILVEEPLLSRWNATSPQGDDAANYFLIKGAVENLLRRLCVADSKIHFEQTAADQWYHPGRCCALYAAVESNIPEENGDGRLTDPQRTLIGIVGEIHPQVCRAYKLKGRPAAFELDLDALRQLAGEPQIRDIHTTPLVVRDLTVDLDNSVPHSRAYQTIVSAAGEYFRCAELVSVYVLSEASKSLSYRLTFQHPHETLTTETIDMILSGIREALSEKVNASFRL